MTCVTMARPRTSCVRVSTCRAFSCSTRSARPSMSRTTQPDQAARWGRSSLPISKLRDADAAAAAGRQRPAQGSGSPSSSAPWIAKPWMCWPSALGSRLHPCWIGGPTARFDSNGRTICSTATARSAGSSSRRAGRISDRIGLPLVWVSTCADPMAFPVRQRCAPGAPGWRFSAPSSLPSAPLPGRMARSRWMNSRSGTRVIPDEDGAAASPPWAKSPGLTGQDRSWFARVMVSAPTGRGHSSFRRSRDRRIRRRQYRDHNRPVRRA